MTKKRKYERTKLSMLNELLDISLVDFYEFVEYFNFSSVYRDRTKAPVLEELSYLPDVDFDFSSSEDYNRFMNFVRGKLIKLGVLRPRFKKTYFINPVVSDVFEKHVWLLPNLERFMRSLRDDFLVLKNGGVVNE